MKHSYSGTLITYNLLLKCYLRMKLLVNTANVALSTSHLTLFWGGNLK